MTVCKPESFVSRGSFNSGFHKKFCSSTHSFVISQIVVNSKKICLTTVVRAGNPAGKAISPMEAFLFLYGRGVRAPASRMLVSFIKFIAQSRYCLVIDQWRRGRGAVGAMLLPHGLSQGTAEVPSRKGHIRMVAMHPGGLNDGFETEQAQTPEQVRSAMVQWP